MEWIVNKLPHRSLWAEIPSAPGYYATTEGEIISSPKVNKPGFRVMRPALSTSGYHMIFVGTGSSKNRTVHRMVAEAFIPNPKDKPCVNHKNGIKTDNRVCNLEWVTHQENLKHAYALGLNPLKRGANSHAARLSQQQVDSIRSQKGSRTQKDLANEFGVSSAHICQLQNPQKYPTIWPL